MQGHTLVVGLFTDIKTGHPRALKGNKIQYFVCLLLCSENLSQAYIHEPQLTTGNDYREILLSM